MAPYLLLGFFIAGILHVYIPTGFFTKWFGKNNLKSVIYASLLGIPLPLCSCGVIPTGISLYKDGASKGSTVAFLISTPQTGVDSVMVTYSLLGLPFAILRPIIALITGIIGGWLVNTTVESSDLNKFEQVQANINVRPKKGLRQILTYAFDEFLQEIADWLVIGLVLAGLIAVLIPGDFFQSAIFKNEWISMFIVLVASVPFYVCATGSVPIAAVLLMKGLNPGAVLVFLMAGPATNIATMTVISRTLGTKVMIIYLSAIVAASMVFGFILNHVFPLSFFTISEHELHDHNGGLMYWIQWVSVVLFVLLLLRIYLKKIRTMFLIRKGRSMTSDEIVNIEVEGMTCRNCAVHVESAIMELPGVNESHASFEKKFVEIKGSNINIKSVKEAVEKTGYKFIKKIEQ